MHKFSTAAANPSVLPTLRDPQAGTPGLRRGQPVADPNRMSGTFFTRVASILPSELFGRATGSPLRRFVTRTYA